MKKNILPVVILVLGLIASSQLARAMHRSQQGINQSRPLVSRSPVAGFQKLLSDLQWIQWIQYCGSSEHVDENHMEEVFRRTDRLLALDPDFAKAYEDGAMMLYVHKPDLALQLLGQAVENPNLSGNWKIPFLAGFIAIRHEAEDDQVRRRWLQKSLGFFQEAYERNAGRTPYILNHLIRTQAKLDADRPFPMAELNAWYDFYQARTDRASPDEWLHEPSLILENLIASGQRCRESLGDHPEARALTDRILAELQEKHHLCFSCFSHYAAGDRFCQTCGQDVKPYGVCVGCGHTLGSRTAFCPMCGQRQPR